MFIQDGMKNEDVPHPFIEDLETTERKKKEEAKIPI